eukprot:2211105-Amphidinium_carterae.1
MAGSSQQHRGCAKPHSSYGKLLIKNQPAKEKHGRPHVKATRSSLSIQCRHHVPVKLYTKMANNPAASNTPCKHKYPSPWLKTLCLDKDEIGAR